MSLAVFALGGRFRVFRPSARSLRGASLDQDREAEARLGPSPRRNPVVRGVSILQRKRW